MFAKLFRLILPFILSAVMFSGCAEFLEDYSYSTGADTYTQDPSASGSRDPFQNYGTYGPTSTSSSI